MAASGLARAAAGLGAPARARRLLRLLRRRCASYCRRPAARRAGLELLLLLRLLPGRRRGLRLRGALLLLLLLLVLQSSSSLLLQLLPRLQCLGTCHQPTLRHLSAPARVRRRRRVLLLLLLLLLLRWRLPGLRRRPALLRLPLQELRGSCRACRGRAV